MARIKYQEVLIDNQDRAWTTLAKVVTQCAHGNFHMACTYVDECDTLDDCFTNLYLRTPPCKFKALESDAQGLDVTPSARSIDL